jgi:hypothetical protein
MVYRNGTYLLLGQYLWDHSGLLIGMIFQTWGYVMGDVLDVIGVMGILWMVAKACTTKRMVESL